MAVHWTITFKSLRAGTVYTASIYDGSYTGNAIPLKGAAEPFSTQEDDTDDMFANIRTQTGYIRIVDDGKDANGNSYNWKSLLPSTDTDRPVILTDDDGNIVWQGFMQAQNFGGVLYGNPQEREYPIQCALSVLQGTDINYSQTGIQNFAYLLQQIIAGIPTLSITNIVIQGGADAQEWLLKRIDWQNFVDEDGDGNLMARYDLFTCLEDMCRFWGWTARTYRQTLFLTCAEDDDEQTFLTLTPAQLATMAGGTAAGNTGGAWITSAISGDVFANTNNNDYRNRGPYKATVQADGNAANNTIMGFADDALKEDMEELGWGSSSSREVDGGTRYWAYTNDMSSFTRPYLTGTSSTGGSFNLMKTWIGASSGNEAEYPVFKISKTYDGSTLVSLQTVYQHAFCDGSFTMDATIYRQGEEFESLANDSLDNGDKTMYMRLGIGTTRADAKWWTGGAWSATQSTFKATIGNRGTSLYSVTSGGNFYSKTIAVGSDAAMSGFIFLDFLGSDDLDNISGVKIFDIESFQLEFSRKTIYSSSSSSGSTWGGNWGGAASYNEVDRSDRREYVSKNSNKTYDEFNADCIFATDNDMEFGFGVLIDPDDTYMMGAVYNNIQELPEQHLADRVTAYWATSKRKIEAELRTNTISEISPRYLVTLDGTTLHPISISQEWRDDITRLTLMEV